MRVLATTIAVVLVDQLSKIMIRQYMELHQSINVIGNFFRLTYVENDGIAFGIGVGDWLPVISGMSVIATFVIAYLMYKERHNHLAIRIALATILGGAIGNLIDRLFAGKVIDFFDFGFGQYRFYIFNVADSAVTVGVALFLIYTTFIYPEVSGSVEESS